MAKAIMIQGTMSNAGKSLFAAALCRIFKQDGYRCAPFKSQNMALNSYITRDGLEIGRAQAMQAEAAGTEPCVEMNPILLKPTTDSGSQIIVNGEIQGNMKAADYFRYKKNLLPEIMHAYQSLAQQYDIIVLEGAGSPVELNLKTDDIVNMGMAKLAKAPVLLVGDIDRGGVFAQLLGTLQLLQPEERAVVKGMIVNKFRGDRRLFDDGVRILEEKGRIPVVGVVPYLHCDLEDEDSLSEKLQRQSEGSVTIAVIQLPRISNFTDFDVFSQYPGVSVRYITKPEQVKHADLILLPGTKSTISDCKWLKETGFAAQIQACAAEGIPVFGICGGYQILGMTISDPEGMEGGGTIQGMGLLPVDTVFRTKKTRTRMTGTIQADAGFFSALKGAPLEGYEIHMGETILRDPAAAFSRFSDGRMDGAFQGTVGGSYLHGIFDTPEVSETMVKLLHQKKGIPYQAQVSSRRAYKELQYDLLADGVRKAVDMDLIYRILEEGI